MRKGSANPDLSDAIAKVPPGAWAVGVSGGADSVALLRLLRQRDDLNLHVAHLDHQLREESGDDAKFVVDLSHRLDLPCTVMHREAIEKRWPNLPANPSARYRAMRLVLFDQIIQKNKRIGVILAHHADDQAETIFQRMLRGSGAIGLGGMTETARVSGIEIWRPLLRFDRQVLRAYLNEIGQTWREDASNASPDYLRNQLRMVLRQRVELKSAFLNLGASCAEFQHWVESTAPITQETLSTDLLAKLPRIVAARTAAVWLVRGGVPIGEIFRPVTQRLLTMALDAAAPAQQQFPGNYVVNRKEGLLSIRRG